MTTILALAASAAAFIAAVRFVPGLDFSQGRYVAGFVVVTALVAAVSTYLPAAVERVRRPATLALVGAVSVAVQAVLLLIVAALGDGAGFGLRIGSWPTGFGLDVLLSVLAAAAVLSIVPVVIASRADVSIPLPTFERPRRGPSTVILVMFLLSGAAGLIYEVVWARQLVLVFGNTTQAVSAILTGYFGGLAIGSVIGGRVADRVRSPLRLYGIVELVLVVVVLLTPLLFRGLHEVYRGWYASFETAPTALALLRYLLALLALAPATILMGATLPTLSRHLTHRRDELSTNFARLYAANTVGAFVGTLLAGVVLIELFGLTAALAVGAAGSGIAGIAAIILAGRSRADPVTRPVAPAAEPDALPPSPTRSLGLVVAFVSGVTSLGYQVLWTRLLASGSGNNTYIFTLILSIFLAGIAVGAAIFVRRLSGSGRLVAAIGLSQLVIAVLVLAGLPLLARLIELPFFVRLVVVVLPTTLVLGLTLPMASSLVGADEHRSGRDAGLLLGANTLGAICGTFVIPFLLIPAIGSPRSVAALALVNALVGAAILLRDRAIPLPRPAIGTAALALVLVAGTAVAVPNPVVVDPGLTVFSRRAGEVHASMEDEISTVTAGTFNNGRKRLAVGGTAMTTLTVDARLMTLLPLMANPDAQDVLVICFGMGSAWRSGLVAGLATDGVELVPSVPGLFDYYHPDATNLTSDPRGRIIVADGRNYVELTDRRYDLVVVDPPPPIQSSGTAILYSLGFYEANARLLREGGVMMEWMPFGQTVDEFRAHVRTFARVFPEVTLSFAPTHHGVYLFGSQRPIVFDPAAIREVLERPGVMADLEASNDPPVHTVDDWVELIPTLQWLGTEGSLRFAGTGPLITDDQPLPEYFILRRTFGPPSPRVSEEALLEAYPRE